MRLRCASELVALVALISACSTPAKEGERHAETKAAITTSTQRLEWKESGLGFMPSVTERLARGPAAIAVHPKGNTVYVLDNVNGRVVRRDRDKLAVVASVPKDCDDLAVGPDGAIAVRRSVKPEVLVIDRGGNLVGTVDTSAVEVEHLALLSSRRVAVTSPFQETFLLGSPSLPQLPQMILANKREGAAQLADGSGVVAVRNDDGELELRAVRPGPDGQSSIVHRRVLGKGSAASVAGASGTVACARIEHAVDEPSGTVSVTREAACVDMATGTTLLREALPAPGPYVPRRELAFSGKTLAGIFPREDGIEIRTWTVEGGAR